MLAPATAIIDPRLAAALASEKAALETAEAYKAAAFTNAELVKELLLSLTEKKSKKRRHHENSSSDASSVEIKPKKRKKAAGT